MDMHRRTAERTYPSDDRIGWGHALGGVLSPGVIKNVSESGVLIEIPEDSAVAHGDAIRTMVRESAAPRRARVVRVEHEEVDGAWQTRIGCRWLTGRDRRITASAHPRHPRRRINP